MSVYSGFATRQQETLYDKLVEKALQMLSTRVLECFQEQGGISFFRIMKTSWR